MAITATANANTRARARATAAVLLTGLAAIAARPCQADDARRIAVHVQIGNASGAALECQALAAHWYSFPVARLEPGGNILLSFMFAPARGEVIAEALGGLPIEDLYCGRAGQAWATRGAIDVRAAAMHAAGEGGRVRVVCRTDADAVLCDMDR
jgi:hypothetical protein